MKVFVTGVRLYQPRIDKVHKEAYEDSFSPTEFACIHKVFWSPNGAIKLGSMAGSRDLDAVPGCRRSDAEHGLDESARDLVLVKFIIHVTVRTAWFSSYHMVFVCN